MRIIYFLGVYNSRILQNVMEYANTAEYANIAEFMELMDKSSLYNEYQYVGHSVIWNLYNTEYGNQLFLCVIP